MRPMTRMRHEEGTTHGTDLRKGSMGELVEGVVLEKGPQKQRGKGCARWRSWGVERVSM